MYFYSPAFFVFHRITSGAGQEAQMIARICPAAMIFVPSMHASATVKHSLNQGSITDTLTLNKFYDILGSIENTREGVVST